MGSQAGALRQVVLRREDDRPPQFGQLRPGGGVRDRRGADDKARSSSVQQRSVPV